MNNMRAGGLVVLALVLAAGSIGAMAPALVQSRSAQVIVRPQDATAPHVPVHAISPAYPLKTSVNHRYLVDQNEQPFLMMGDSPQGLIANVSEAEVEMFFADRKANGFNAAWVNLLCGTYTGGRPDGSTYDGILPFTTPMDLSTPNPSYFARVDHMLQIAARHGIVIVLDPA